MLTVVCWKWQQATVAPLFSATYVNRLRAGLEKHLHVDHELVCVTDNPDGIDRRVRVVPMPTTYAATPRCRRRMQHFDRAWALEQLGPRCLAIDLDVVIVDDLTPIVDRPEPLVAWKVGHAGVYSGSFLMFDAGALQGAWDAYAADPEGYPASISPERVPSDQAMVNAYVRAAAVPVAEWTESDGFVTYYGAGYAKQEHLGVGPTRTKLPEGARIVVLGSKDNVVMDTGRYEWVREHWSALPGEAGA